MSKLFLPNFGDDIDISWSCESPDKLEFLDLKRIPTETAVRHLKASAELYPGDVHIRSIRFLRSGNQPTFLPIATYRYWLDIHNLIPRINEIREGMAWLNEKLPYNSPVIYHLCLGLSVNRYSNSFVRPR